MGSSGVVLGLWGVASVTAVGAWNIAKFLIARAGDGTTFGGTRQQLDATTSSSRQSVDVA